jgi:hypothetical protein
VTDYGGAEMKLLVRIALLLVVIVVGLSRACNGTGGEKIIKVADFPDTAEFQHEEKVSSGPPRKVHVDAGYIWKQDKFLDCPIFNDKGRYIGFIGDENTYLDLKPEQINELAKEAYVFLPESPTLPFWDAMGGKVAAVGILAVLILFSVGWNAFWRFLKPGI